MFSGDYRLLAVVVVCQDYDNQVLPYIQCLDLLAAFEKVGTRHYTTLVYIQDSENIPLTHPCMYIYR